MKIKCFRFPCEVCGGGKVASSIQVFYRKDGSAGYARARHKGENKFYYHQQSIEYVKNKIRELSNIDQGQHFDSKNIDQTKDKSSCKLKLEPSAGFGPATITLPR